MSDYLLHLIAHAIKEIIENSSKNSNNKNKKK